MIVFTSTAASVTLPNPILGNSEQFNTHVKYGFSMSTKVRSTIKTVTHSKLLLGFTELTTASKEALKAFLLTSRGLAVTYTDYDTIDWVGSILGDTFEFVHVGSDECTELWSITIEFQVTNLPTLAPDS